MMTKLAACFFCVALLFSVGACGDDDGGTPDGNTNKEAGPDGPAPDMSKVDAPKTDGPQPDGPQPDTTGGAPSFSKIYTDVIQPNCSCHLGGTHSTGLTMADANSAYSNLVGAATGGAACSGKTRVTAGDSAQSVLFHKLTGGASLCGSRMPLGGAQISQSQIDLVKAWIDGGAKQ